MLDVLGLRQRLYRKFPYLRMINSSASGGNVRRPTVLQVLPDRIAVSVYARLYCGKHDRWAALYHDAELRHAPGVRMDLVPGM